MLVNLLLLKGNIGRDGTGISPVRGHSNVQGQRTVGITEKPELVPLDKLCGAVRFRAAAREGHEYGRGLRGDPRRKVKAFFGLGGNFVRAIPERGTMEEAWPRMRLTVQIATKLNRSHLVNGEVAYLLPCLGRTEQDIQASGPAGGHDGGYLQLHPWLARPPQAGERASADPSWRSSPGLRRRRCRPIRR